MTKSYLPLAVALARAEALRDALAPYCERIEIAGSIRRQRPHVGDIEIVAVPKLLDAQRDLFGAESSRPSALWGYLDRVVPMQYRKKWGGKYRQYVETDEFPVDIFTARPETWGLILMIRTGSADFSQYVVTRLRERGTPSVEGRVVDAEGRAIPTPEEADVFHLAGMAYREPREREV